MNFAALFPDEDFRFHMAVQRGNAEEFFQPTAEHAALMVERQRWLRSEPQVYSAALPECGPLLDECIELAQSWGALPDDSMTPEKRCIRLGESWEPDFLLLKANASGAFHLLGGCICFPSSWSLEEKIGKPMDFIHGPVPGLNAQLGQPVQSFLAKLSANRSADFQVGTGLGPERDGLETSTPTSSAWLRHNWGLSRSPELNQHPRRTLPKLDLSVALEEVCLRVERQALVPLPRSSGVLFGIRIEMYPLVAVKADTLTTQRLTRALRTMPSAVAAYKGLSSARERIVELLER